MLLDGLSIYVVRDMAPVLCLIEMRYKTRNDACGSFIASY